MIMYVNVHPTWPSPQDLHSVDGAGVDVESVCPSHPPCLGMHLPDCRQKYWSSIHVWLVAPPPISSPQASPRGIQLWVVPQYTCPRSHWPSVVSSEPPHDPDLGTQPFLCRQKYSSSPQFEVFVAGLVVSLSQSPEILTHLPCCRQKYSSLSHFVWISSTLFSLSQPFLGTHLPEARQKVSSSPHLPCKVDPPLPESMSFLQLMLCRGTHSFTWRQKIWSSLQRDETDSVVGLAVEKQPFSLETHLPDAKQNTWGHFLKKH